MVCELGGLEALGEPDRLDHHVGLGELKKPGGLGRLEHREHGVL